jgi:signal transduction histidine kinase
LVMKNIELFREQLDSKNIRAMVEIDPDHFIYVDGNMMDTILRNLLSNCLKFTYPGGVIKIYSEKNGDKISIMVSDSGRGMDEQQLQDIFTEHKNYSSNGTNGEPGSGLGLLIVKEFIQANKGEIEVESKKNHGTCFKLQLPVAEIDSQTDSVEDCV